MPTFYALDDVIIKKKPRQQKGSENFYALDDVIIKKSPKKESTFDTVVEKAKAGARGCRKIL